MPTAKTDSTPEHHGQGGNEKFAAEIVAQVESGPRDPIHWAPVVLTLAICFGWSAFQLYHAQFPLNAKVARYIHLAFALSLAFLAYPAFKAGVGAAAARTKRDIIRKGVILAAVAIAAGVIFFTDPVGGSLLFLAIFGFFFLIGIGLPQEVKRNLYVGLLLATAAFLLWSNIGPILTGLATDAEGNPRTGLFDYWLPHAILFAVAIGSLVEAPRRLLSAVWQLFGGKTEPSALVTRVLGLRINERARDVIPFQDYILALLGIGTTLYLILDFIKIATVSQGMIDGVHQLVFGVLLIMVLLEAARRSLGMPLVILSAVFLVYDLYAGFAFGRGTQVPWLDSLLGGLLPQLKDWLQPPPNILEAVIGTMYLQANAIFGTPIEVSTTYVFLFVLFGALLERAGAGKYFIDVAFAGLGSQRAGPAKAAIVASGATGLVSGSSIANTVTTGTFTIPLMIKVGLPPYKAGAVEVAASTNGQLMPPIMGAAAFIMAEYTGLKYASIVQAAIIPAVISYLALFYVVHLEALKLDIRSIPKNELPPLLKTFLRGMHYLIPLAVLIYYLIVVRYSPIQSVVYAIVALAVLMVVQRPIIAYLALGREKRATGRVDLIPWLAWVADRLNKRDAIEAMSSTKQLLLILWAAFVDGILDLYHGMIQGARNMISVGIAVATAGIIIGVVQESGLVGRFTSIINTLAFGNIVLVLVLTAVTSMILGMGLPTTANYIIMATLTAPVILQLGEAQNLMIPVVAAHLFVFYFGILADDTPPVGLAAYAAAAIAKSDPIRTGIQGFTYDLRTAILPFVFVFNTELLMISGLDAKGEPIWIDNLLLIGFIFVMALAGMCAFAAFLQGYLADRCTIVERLLVLLGAVLMFVPALLVQAAGIGEGDTYQILRRAIQVAGLALVLGLYMMQRSRMKRRAELETQAA